MDVIGFLCVSLGSSTVQLYDSLGSRRACSCSEASFSSQNGDCASQQFMEPECSLPCSQESSTGSHPEPDRSSSCHPFLSLSKIHFNIIHPPCVWVFLVVSFLLAFPAISYMHSSSTPIHATCSAYLILLDLIILIILG
jgi:hypothetical protein